VKRAILAITGILGGVLFAAGAGTGISLLITHTYWSAKHTTTVTLFALLIAYFIPHGSTCDQRDKFKLTHYPSEGLLDFTPQSRIFVSTFQIWS
jgi:hypothetical protein